MNFYSTNFSLKFSLAIALSFCTHLNVIGQSNPQFTAEEELWLSENPIVYYGCDPEWEPIGFLSDAKEYVGISAEFLQLIEEKSGIDFVLHPKATNWDRSLDLIGQGKILMLPALGENALRDSIMDFTDPYLSYPFVIVTRKNSEFIGQISDLEGKTIAQPRNYWITQQIENEPHDIDFIYEPGIEECLWDLESGKADAVVGNLAVTSYYLNYEGFENLKIAAPTTYPNIDIRMGVLQGNDELVSILQKSINSIPIHEKNKIIQNWISVEYEFGVNMKKVWSIAGLSFGIILVFILVILYWNRRLKKEVIKTVKAENSLRISNEKILQVNQMLEIRNKEILDSITYAKHIQRAILPKKSKIDNLLNDYFIFYRPKDIVSGDFYWLSEKKVGNDQIVFIASADCTGHGVPGAMVSFVCSNALDRSVTEFDLNDPGEILDKTKEIVSERLNRGDENVKDGMDISLISINTSSLPNTDVKIKCAAAYNNIWVISKRDDLEIEARKSEFEGVYLYDIQSDHQTVGQTADIASYSTNEFNLRKGDRVFMYSDGFSDQFGGEKGKKFKSKNFKKLLLQTMSEPIQDQKVIIEEQFNKWKEGYEQVDDVVVIGLEI